MSSILQTLKRPYDCVLRLYSSKTQKSVSPSQRCNVFNSILSPIETYVVSLQSLLIWERPYLSAGAFVTLNIFYWLIVSWNRRLFSIVSHFAAAVFMYRTWVNLIWPEIRMPTPEGEDSESWTTVHPGCLSVPEICKHMNDATEEMKSIREKLLLLRKENHGMFCFVTCFFFLILSVIGRLIPGVILVYIIVLLMTIGPGIFLHLIPRTFFDQLTGIFSETEHERALKMGYLPRVGERNEQVDHLLALLKSAKTSGKDSDIDEFLPEVSAEMIRQLSLKVEVPEIPSPGRVLTEPMNPEYSAYSEIREESSLHESDEYSLYQGLGAFPSVEEEGESDIEEENSDIAVPLSTPLPLLKADPGSGMHFDPQHFREDSSESESDVFTEGLSFEKPPPTQVLPSTSQIKQETPEQQPPQHKLSSSDVEDDLMDFEILEESDIPT